MGTLLLAGACLAQSVPAPASDAAAPVAAEPATSATIEAEAFAAKVNPSYYSLTEAGFDSLTCTASLDWIGLSPESIAVLPKNIVSRIKQTSFEITMPLHGPVSVTTKYPAGLTAAEKSEDAPALNILAGYLSGYFTMWPTITASGPLPSSALIAKIEHDAGASHVFLSKSDIEIVFDEAGTLNEIIIRLPDREIDQHPKFIDTSGRLIIQSNDVASKSGDKTNSIHTDEAYQSVDGVQIPATIHMTASGTDASFTMRDCSVKKAAPADPQ
jgi:hypothetical protein